MTVYISIFANFFKFSYKIRKRFLNSDRPVTLKYIPERLLLTDQGSGLILFVSRTLIRLKINQILLLPNFTNLLESNQLRKFKSMITVTLTKIK